MSNLNTINPTEQTDIALAEQAAKDLISIGEALSGLLGLHQGSVVVGMSATQYLDALRSLVAAADNNAVYTGRISEMSNTHEKSLRGPLKQGFPEDVDIPCAPFGNRELHVAFFKAEPKVELSGEFTADQLLTLVQEIEYRTSLRAQHLS